MYFLRGGSSRNQVASLDGSLELQQSSESRISVNESVDLGSRPPIFSNVLASQPTESAENHFGSVEEVYIPLKLRNRRSTRYRQTWPQ
jgi:hypothetical protein